MLSLLSLLFRHFHYASLLLHIDVAIIIFIIISVKYYCESHYYAANIIFDGHWPYYYYASLLFHIIFSLFLFHDIFSHYFFSAFIFESFSHYYFISLFSLSFDEYFHLIITCHYWWADRWVFADIEIKTFSNITP